MRNSRAIAILSVMFGLGLFLVGGTLLFSPSNSYGQDIPGVKATPGEGDLIRNISLTNADIRSVMMYLSAISNRNIVVAPQVDARVTLVLSDVTWRQALDIITETYGLVGVDEKDYIRVVKAQDYFAERRALEQYNSEQAALKNLRTRIIAVKYNVAKELSKAVEGLLSPRGAVSVDERTNSPIIRDLPENLDRIDELVAVLDKETRQIKISAQLLEIESRTLRELGFDWRILSNNGTLLYDPLSEDPADPDPSDYWPDYDAQQNTSQNFTQTPVGDLSFSTPNDNDFVFKAIMRMAEATNKVKVIAHPEVTTVDNIEAFIQMGSKIPIKQFDPSGNTIITFYDVGIQLRVTPHITSENRILLNLKPERSSYQFDPNGIIINTQNAETNVVVDNRQTAVIAGLTKQEELNLRVGIPILKDIPLLGYLFSYDKKEIQNQDLVIFVTPTIIEERVATGY